jgi:uncharacterized protein YjbI with pentapeptide repeats
MALSFVGQDLRNRSFKGRRDLAGADFTGADLRGCDFRGADLTGANFTGAKTGKSRRQWMILIAYEFSMSFCLLTLSLLPYSTADVFIHLYMLTKIDPHSFIKITSILFIGVFSVAGVILRTSTGATFRTGATGAALGFLIALAFGLLHQTYNVFSDGKISEYFFNITICVGIIALIWYILHRIIRFMRQVIGTDLNGADLTGAKFVNTQLRVTDFTNANCNWVNWQGVKFYLCKLPHSMANKKVRYLCCNPDKGRGQDYTSLDFRNTYLENADLVDAILCHANLNGADLRGAKLINADLSNSQALGTDFTGADFSGARIANWGINPETNFENVSCTHVYIDKGRQERKPASGEFAEGDFALLVGEFTNTLDFLFKNEINSSAFQYAMQQMLSKNPEAEISLNQTKFIGQDKESLQRSYDVLSDTDTSRLHADFSEAYDAGKRLYPEANQLIRDLNGKIMLLEKELRAEKDARIADLKDASTGFKEIARIQAATPSTINNTQQLVQGDQNKVSGKDQNTNTTLQSGGGNMTGITVAGGDISGTVTVTIQQLRDSDTPEAPQLADLLTQLQQAINESTELAAPDKEKALKYLDKIGKLANDQEPDRDVISMAIDGILGIVSKAAKLLAPVQGIADGLRKLLNL